MGGGWVEPDLRSSLKRITLVSNHTDLTLRLFFSSILSTYEYSSNLPEFALNPRVNPGLNPRVNPRVNPGLNPRVNPGLNPGLPPGTNQVKRRFQLQSVPFRSKIGVQIVYTAIF